MKHKIEQCHYDYAYLKYKKLRDITKDDLPGSVLFESIAPTETLLLAEKAQDFFGINRTVYGITETKDKHLDFELYSYYPNMFPKHSLSNIVQFLNAQLPSYFVQDKEQYMVSFKINSCKEKPKISIYKPNLSCRLIHNPYINREYCGYLLCSKCKAYITETLGEINPEYNYGKFFYKNETTKDDIANYIENITQQKWNKLFTINDLIPSRILQFDRLSIAVTLKPNNVIGIYVSQINAEDLLTFLTDYNFNKNVTNKLKQNLNSFTHLLFDIGYNVKYEPEGSANIARVGFYGIL